MVKNKKRYPWEWLVIIGVVAVANPAKLADVLVIITAICICYTSFFEDGANKFKKEDKKCRLILKK